MSSEPAPRDAGPAAGPAILVRSVEVDGHDLPVDVLVEGGVVTDVGLDLAPRGDVEVVDGEGAALLPGLHDHHVHLLAMAARAAGLDLDGLPTPAAVDAALRAAAPSSPSTTFGPTSSGPNSPPPDETVRSMRVPAREKRTVSGRGGVAGGGIAGGGVRWVRASGYDEHRHGPMDRRRLDAVAPGVAVRVQHRSGLGWVLSTPALRAVGLLTEDGTVAPHHPKGVELGSDGTPTGWLLRLDGWLGERVPPSPIDLAVTGRCLAAAGVTGVTDATYALGAERLERLRRAVTSGELPQRVVLLGVEPGEVDGGWARVGPAKLLADESLGLDPSALAAAIVRHHRAGRPVAIHAVTRAENVVAVAALAEAGALPGDRIEHGSVLPPELDPVLATSGVTVVAQPSLVTERGDHHLATVEDHDLPHLHRHASLLAHGVRVGVGSDAPVTTADPWAGISAASTRRTRGGATVGPDEAVDARTALGWYLADPSDPGGPPRRIRPGAPADLCLLDGPLADVLAAPSVERVRATWAAGRLVHR